MKVIFMRLQGILILAVIAVLQLAGCQHPQPEGLPKMTETQREPMPEKLAVMTFDDSTRSHLEVAAPLLKARGFGATFFVTAAWMDDHENFLDWEEMAKLHEMGFEVGNHSMHHVALHDPDPIETLDREVQELEAGLAAVGVPKPVSFSWPGNHFGPRAADRLRELGYRFARRGTVPDVPADVPVVGMGPVYDPARHDPMLVPSSGLAVPSWTLEDFKQVVAPARQGKIIVFQFHGTPDGAHPFCSTPAEEYEAFLDYLVQENFTVIAMRDLERYIDPDARPADPLMEAVHYFN